MHWAYWLVAQWQLPDWQMVAAGLCVAAAAAAMAMRVRRWASGNARSGCDSCPASQSSAIVPLSSVRLSPSLKSRQADAAPEPEDHRGQ